VRRPILLTAVVAVSLLLSACSDDTTSESDPTATESPAPGDATVAEPTEEDIAALAAVTVEGPLGATPTVTFDMPFSVSAPVSRLDIEGTGAVIEDGQTMSVHYAVFDGDNGSALGSTWDTGATQDVVMGDPTLVGVMSDAFKDQRVGARILVAAPGTPATETTEASAASVMVMEVVSVRDVPKRAWGETVEPPDGLPVVTLLDSGEPLIEMPPGVEKPTELVTQTLIKGDGPVVEAGQNITVHYSGWLWDGTLFDSSWQSGTPFPTLIGAGQLIPAWDEGLVGQTVGSQVLLVVPPDMGYGAEGAGDIPADATLIFVVDVLEAATATVPAG
jgi:peptidylprolyl isomerase